jgi:hypothetical protein
MDGSQIMFVQVSGLGDATVRRLYTTRPNGSDLRLMSDSFTGVDKPDWGSNHG